MDDLYSICQKSIHMNSQKKITPGYYFFIIVVLLIINMGRVQSQPPEIFDSGTLQEQYNYLHERTNIYNNFRAIREDMFQKIRRNSQDSLNAAFREIRLLNQQLTEKNSEIDSLSMSLQTTIEQRDEAVRERDSLFLFGIPMSKTFYNLLLWSIIGGLVIFLVIGFMLYQRTRMITIQKTNDLKELTEEHENYRKSSRERFEQQSIDHFNEIKRLKGRL